MRFVQCTRSVTQHVTKVETVHDRLPQSVTVCQLATFRRLNVVIHTYTNVCGIIIVEQGILLYFACLFVLFAVCHDPSRTIPLLATHY